MRSFSTIAAVASLAATAFAWPESIFQRGQLVERDGSCMSLADATQVADNFQALIANYTTDLANAALTEDFTDTSSGVNTLIDAGCTGPQDLNAATFTGRAAFEAGQGSQPAIPFERLNLWYNCDNVFLRWVSLQSPEQVTGIIVLETSQASAGAEYPWLINTVYSEFNSGAWLVNLGTFVPSNCSASSKRSLRA